MLSAIFLIIYEPEKETNKLGDPPIVDEGGGEADGVIEIEDID